MNLKQLKIFYFGNPYLAEDNFAIKVANKLKAELKDITFTHIENTFQLLDLDLKNAILLDVVYGLKKPSLVDASRIISDRKTTTHDIDLGFIIKLKNLKNKDLRIIGLPHSYPEKDALREVKALIKQLEK